jgi:cell division protein FtsB
MRSLSNGLRRIWPTLILFTFAMLLAYDCVAGPMGVRDLLALRQHQARLETARDRLIAENDALTRRVANLQSDDRSIERLIRRELGYARPDELIYRFAGDGGRDR